ncbi:hypothetical protein [uncultured Microbacterium sp.]|uniref:hypothetical protein n=1 Tax=uncultured Microbacterium sp. TaxID=191216 RepID=UPI0028D15F8C|nr:hypothetical protein [uncultured Microbacterium sp.]
MPTRTTVATPPHRLRGLLVALTAILIGCAGAIVTAPAAHAASQGVGFGTWAPLSPYGWHGSMLVDGVHTYCILPGVPLPTGPTVDNGVSGTAAGLSAEQLTGINLLVTKYGQTEDPVQAASVGWAVKAIANRDETLHHFGYRGDSLAEAIHWTFSALAPEHSAQIQHQAVAFYDEARAVAPGPVAASGTMVFTTDAADSTLGSVRVEATTSAASGTLSLSGALFVASGTPILEDAVPGIDYPIVTSPASPGRPYAVSGSGHFTLTVVAAVRHFTTAGGQDTAGPAGDVGFDVAGADAVPRVPTFAPTIATRVQSPITQGGPFIDDVVFAGSLENWPRTEDGRFVPVNATAAVYRTDERPELGAAPGNAEQVGSLALSTDPDSGPTGPYRVTSVWELPRPGFYTAVWTIGAEGQSAEVVRALPHAYSWTEPFGEPTQTTFWPEPESVTPPPSAAPPAVETPPAVTAPPALAATGASGAPPRAMAGSAIGMLTVGATLLALARRRRYGEATG